MIRRATPDDAAEVARLLHDFNTEYEDWTPGVAALTGHYRELIAADELVVLLAGEGPDGFCQFRLRRSHYTGRPDACVEELYVVPGAEARSLYESAGFSNREGGEGGPRMLYYERER